MRKEKPFSRRLFLKTMLMAGSAAAIDWTGFGALAAAVRNPKAHPVVVIGAGLGGLVSAAYLSKFGFPVTLIEQHNIPGGYATTFERDDFTFDVSLHATVAEHAMPQMILSDLGVWDKLKVAYAPELRRIITSSFDVTLPAKSPVGVKQNLSRVFPHEKQGIHDFYAQMEQVIQELWTGRRFKVSMMAFLEKISLEEWMALHVKDPDVKYCLAVFSGYYGLEPSKINALFYAIATGEYLVHGGQYYKTRSQDLSDTLARAVEDNGGHIFYDTRVENILFDDKTNMISGVQDSNKKIYPARAVIANCSVPALFGKMVPEKHIPEKYEKKLKKHKPSLSSFVVWLGLNKPVDNIKDYEIDIRRGNSENRLYDRMDLAKSDIGVTIYDNLFKGYSSPGKSTLSIMTLSDYKPWEKFEQDYFNGNKDAYNKEKHRIAQSFIKKVEETLIPGLENMIEIMEIGTPLTNIYYTGNPKGAIYGFDRDLEHLKVTTPIKGLYLAGAWASGGGYTPVMMSGREAAKVLLKDFNTEA